MALPLCLPFAQIARADTSPAHSSLATVLQLQQMEAQAKAHPAPPVPSPANRLANTPYAAPRVSAPALAPALASAAVVPSKAAPPRPASPTLLDEVGRLARVVSPAEAAGWKRTLHTQSPAPARAALLHLWLGEWELAANQQPRAARAQFAQAQRLTTAKDDVYGLAAYDTATALFYEGAYGDAQDAFHRLLVLQTCLPGYSRRTCARWYRHAAACAGSHADHEKLGIPEPPRLDPECGAAALAACLRGLSVPCDRSTVLAACRVTGEGSSLQDVLEAARKLGLTGRAITADDVGLMALPKPLVAYVEQDHFVALVRADKAGVSYLCSDCGPWPGGRVNLTWAQWHSLSPGLYGSVVKPGSAWDKKLASVLAPLPVSDSSVRLASARPLVGLGVAEVSALLPALSLLRGHVQRYIAPTAPVTCGYKPTSQQCPPYIICCWDCYHHAMNQGPSDGDPVNLSTGEEEYQPAPDLTVYNPVGPSVTWGRVYNSLRDNYNSNPQYLATGINFGSGWDYSYDIYVSISPSDPTTGKVVLPNGSSIHLSNLLVSPYSPGSGPYGTPNGQPYYRRCTIDAGANMTVSARYQDYQVITYYADGSSSIYTYTQPLNSYMVTLPDRTQWLFVSGGFTPVLGGNSGNFFGITAIVDRNGHSLTFSATNNGYTINNNAGTALLSVNRLNNAISTITDCYHRRVCYHVGTYNTTNVPSGYPQSYSELDHVSQIVPDSMTSGPDRYAYGYVGVYNGDTGTSGQGPTATNPNAGEHIQFLNSITVPTPSSANPASGTLSAGMAGTSSSYINYSPNTCYVSSLVDGNNNTRTYTVVDGTHTKVTVTNAQGQAVFSGTSGFSGNMSKQGETDGNNASVYQVLSWDPNDPARPAQTKDGNGNVSSYTWDTVGNTTSMTPPSNSYRTPAKTTYTYSYTNFALGELTAVQEGSKTSTLYAYYEPSGLVSTIQTPVAGSVGSTTRSTTTYAYDGLGNVLTAKTPGNNATVVNGVDQGITTTYNYTTDGGYSQTAAIGQPITVTDNLGEVTHYRYDSQGNPTSDTDGVGWEHDYSYNIANQSFQTVDQGTSQTGSGNAYQQRAYAYPGGPQTSMASYDESKSYIPVQKVYYAYGAEGETLAVSGSTEPVSYTYDALYRLSTLTDGGNNLTRYFYNMAGYLYQMAYPGAGAGTAPLAAGTGDTVTFPQYDLNGNVKTRVDGDGITTTYAYNDPESLLTGISYAYPNTYGGGRTGNVSLSYDAYGRRAGMTDGTGNTSYNYDDSDNPTLVSTYYTGLPAALNINYYYNADSSRLGMGTPAGSFSYGYDAAGRETSLSNPNNELTKWSYYNNNLLQSQTFANSVRTVYSYNQRGLMIDQTTKTNAGTLLSEYGGFGQGASMTYDGVGNRLFMPVTMPQSAALYSGTTNYAYDSRSQLKQEQSSRNNYNDLFTYDGGNINGPGNPTSMRSFGHTYNGDNQDTANRYDGNGNPYNYQGTSLWFDPENRLTQFGSAVVNAYNGDGLRAKKTFNNGGAYNWFLYDGDQPVCEVDSSGNVSALNTWGANGLVSRRTNSTTLLYSFDPSGSGSLLTDGNANVIASSVADGFGNTATTATDDPYFGFGGQWGYYYDAQDGLHLLGHRFYDRSTGRFLTRDPIGYNGGVNLYNYTGNNPVNNTDPEGTQAVAPPVVTVGPGGIIGAGVLAGVDLYNYMHGGRPGPFTGVGDGLGSILFPPTMEMPGGSKSDEDTDYEKYKALCDEPVQGKNYCDTLRLNIERLERCISAREAWDKKYNPGKHDDQIDQKKRELNNKKKQYRRCPQEKCP